jgi:hypothetical protein
MVVLVVLAAILVSVDIGAYLVRGTILMVQALEEDLAILAAEARVTQDWDLT